MRKGLEPKKSRFFTPQDNPLQLGIIKYKKGYKIKPHIHRRSKRVIYSVQEVLHIVYGKVRVIFYDEKGEKIKSALLREGDTVLFIEGGHAIEVLEDFKGIEVKQGPYRGIQEDKRYLKNDSSL